MINNFTFIFAFLVTLSFCPSASGSERCPIPAVKVKTEDEAVAIARRVAVTYNLISKPLWCYEFDTFTDSGDFKPEDGYQFDVRLGPKKECDGDPEFAPRLFSLRIYRNGTVLTDDAGYRFSKPVCPKPQKRKKTSVE